MTEKEIQEWAAEIARDLFVSGQGEHAGRLVMELGTKLNGPGWSEAAVTQRIAKYLRASVTFK